jgi:hypothetical protein
MYLSKSIYDYRFTEHSFTQLTKRFRSHLSQRPYSNCLWWSNRSSNNYGIFCIHYRNFLAHRVAFELAFGRIPEGLQLDHLCRNTICCNEFHLEAVTAKENMYRRYHKLELRYAITGVQAATTGPARRGQAAVQ